MTVFDYSRRIFAALILTCGILATFPALAQGPSPFLHIKPVLAERVNDVWLVGDQNGVRPGIVCICRSQGGRSRLRTTVSILRKAPARRLFSFGDTTSPPSGSAS